MNLKTLIKSLDSYKAESHLEDFEVRGISCNSKNVQSNFIFVAIKGIKEDGHQFISEAIEKGARLIITQIPNLKLQISKRASFIVVKDTRKALAKLSATFYGNPSGKMKVIGVTGTNGKTTVTYLIEAMLRKADRNPAVIGTINYRFNNKLMPSKNTTPGPLELQFLLADMLKENVDYAVMEVSSHALDQDRTEGIDFHSAIFTNLTQDHLDYHRTLENYFQAKSKLFRNINSNSFAVINNDDVYGRRLKGLTKSEVITYGIERLSDVRATSIKFDISHTEFILRIAKTKINFRTQLIGKHNVYNILAAVAFALKEGLDLSVIKSSVEEFNCVPGRLERINSSKGFSVFIDYAHTDDALKNVIVALREISPKRIIVVFGCGGERDKTKRPKMGRIATELADYVIITNDNPRSEDPNTIIDDIKKGIRKNNFLVIPDRKEAIRKSLLLAKKGDIVLVAGKGHESYQILKDKIIYFNDYKQVKACLRSTNY